jgi:hypothetical protein
MAKTKPSWPSVTGPLAQYADGFRAELGRRLAGPLGGEDDVRHTHHGRMLFTTRITSSTRLDRTTDRRTPSAATSSPRKSAAAGEPSRPSSATAASAPTSPPPAATAATPSPPSATPSPATPGCHRNQHDQLTRHPDWLQCRIKGMRQLGWPRCARHREEQRFWES